LISGGALAVMIEVFIIFLGFLEVCLNKAFKQIMVIDYGLQVCGIV
jgi:hypothetical protein